MWVTFLSWCIQYALFGQITHIFSYGKCKEKQKEKLDAKKNKTKKVNKFFFLFFLKLNLPRRKTRMQGIGKEK